MPQTSQHQPSSIYLWLYILSICISFFLNLGGFPLFDMDEGAYAETTREMFERGDFISTYMNGEAFYDKPILMYWAQAIGVQLLGMNEWGFRLPSALAALLWSWLIVGFIGELYDRQTGYIVASVTSLALLPSVMAKAAIPDALLILFITGAMFNIYRVYLNLKLNDSTLCISSIRMAFVFIALGFLTKGPIAVLIPLVSSFIFFSLKSHFKAWFKAISNWQGILLFLLIASPWFVLQYLREGFTFIEGFFLVHNVGRFQAAMDGHNGNYFYYLPVVLVATLPFTTILVSTIAKAKQLAKNDFLLFMGIWFVFVLLFFSVAATKLPHYLNYGLPGLLIILGLHLSNIKSSFLALLPALVFFVLLLLLPEILAQTAANEPRSYYRESFSRIDEVFGSTYRWFFAVAILVTMTMGVWIKSLQVKVLSAALMLSLGMSTLVIPNIANIIQQPVKNAALQAQTMGLTNLVTSNLNVPSFSVYLGQSAPKIAPRDDQYFIAAPDQIDPAKHQVIYSQGGVVLAGPK